ncbi:HHL175Cp [Eremothecium sinecaudum]|uniref:HHL175Cp n=1 Tax=Eremothecium sinecaudum TaxID=45286 RepID=A0A0X8HWA7_9SACH|nr:HHL175Cp [Eremothecium sinecaudum]AMD22595.1 HHL175Cp [Eremothecium sinecaudum]
MSSNATPKKPVDDTDPILSLQNENCHLQLMLSEKGSEVELLKNKVNQLQNRLDQILVHPNVPSIPVGANYTELLQKLEDEEVVTHFSGSPYRGSRPLSHSTKLSSTESFTTNSKQLGYLFCRQILPFLRESISIFEHSDLFSGEAGKLKKAFARVTDGGLATQNFGELSNIFDDLTILQRNAVVCLNRELEYKKVSQQLEYLATIFLDPEAHGYKPKEYLNRLRKQLMDIITCHYSNVSPPKSSCKDSNGSDSNRDLELSGCRPDSDSRPGPGSFQGPGSLSAKGHGSPGHSTPGTGLPGKSTGPTSGKSHDTGTKSVLTRAATYSSAQDPTFGRNAASEFRKPPQYVAPPIFTATRPESNLYSEQSKWSMRKQFNPNAHYSRPSIDSKTVDKCSETFQELKVAESAKAPKEQLEFIPIGFEDHHAPSSTPIRQSPSYEAVKVTLTPLNCWGGDEDDEFHDDEENKDPLQQFYIEKLTGNDLDDIRTNLSGFNSFE